MAGWSAYGCRQEGLGGLFLLQLQISSHLAQLNLSHNRLSGHLPGRFFASLKRIQMVDLSFNYLSGEINSTDSLSKSIQIVDVSSNAISGRIRSSFFRGARNLMFSNVSNNSFYGALPTSICNFSPSTRVLDFSSNCFSGSISNGFERCSNLKVLRGGFNLLTGPLPDDLYAISTLQELSLPGNRLNGTIGDGIANLLHLQILALYANEFTGEIPRNVGQLSNLKELLFHINKLNGSLPTSLMNCTCLQTLNLRVNTLRGELSSFDFSRFTQLRTVDLSNNFFIGTFPVTLTSCSLLTAVRLSSNLLEGQIPLEIQRLQFLSFLSLSNNSLINISSAIRILCSLKSLSILILSKNFYNESLTYDQSMVASDGFPNLHVLGLDGCQLTGQIPFWLSKLGNLEVLVLSANRFTGPVPNELGNLPKLFYLDLSQNMLSCCFLGELMKLQSLTSQKNAGAFSEIHLELPVFVNPDNFSALQYNQISNLPPSIYLNNNNFSGYIPEEIGLLKYLHELDISFNKFSGEIPHTISNLTNLETLDLSHNKLHGGIPAALKNLFFLSSFSVANNLLEGPIPIGGQFDTFPSSSFEGNPGLCGPVLQRSCRATLTPESLTGRTREKSPFWLSFGICFGISICASVQIFGRLFKSPKSPKYVEIPQKFIKDTEALQRARIKVAKS